MTRVAPPPTPVAASARAPIPKPLVEASRQLEAVFSRTLLSALEKAGNVGGRPSASTGAYGSMVVDALSTAIADAGGFGLSELIARSLMQRPEMAVESGSSSAPRAPAQASSSGAAQKS
jgi:Rod binding domain-containing protein